MAAMAVVQIEIRFSNTYDKDRDFIQENISNVNLNTITDQDTILDGDTIKKKDKVKKKDITLSENELPESKTLEKQKLPKTFIIYNQCSDIVEQGVCYYKCNHCK